MPPSPTTTLPAVLRDGSDADLRAFLYDLFAAAGQLAAIRESFAARLGMTGLQFHILMAVQDLAPDGPVGIKQLSAHLRIAPPNATVEVSKLVAADLLEKRRAESDGRAVEIRLTRKANSALNGLHPLVRDTNDRMFRDLDRKSFDTVRRSLAAIRRNGEDVVASLRSPETVR